MKTAKKPKVGQILYSLNVGNAARHCEQKLTPVKVLMVGSKYFRTQKLNSGLETKFHIEDWREVSIWSPNQALYETEAEYNDEVEERGLCGHIGLCFQHGVNRQNLPLAALREIKRIIDTEKRDSE